MLVALAHSTVPLTHQRNLSEWAQVTLLQGSLIPVGWISRKHLPSGRGRSFFLTSLLIEHSTVPLTHQRNLSEWAQVTLLQGSLIPVGWISRKHLPSGRGRSFFLTSLLIEHSTVPLTHQRNLSEWAQVTLLQGSLIPVGWISRKHLPSGRGRSFFLTSLLIEHSTVPLTHQRNLSEWAQVTLLQGSLIPVGWISRKHLPSGRGRSFFLTSLLIEHSTVPLTHQRNLSEWAQVTLLQGSLIPVGWISRKHLPSGRGRSFFLTSLLIEHSTVPLTHQRNLSEWAQVTLLQGSLIPVGWISRKHLPSGRGRSFFLTSLLIEHSTVPLTHQRNLSEWAQV